MATFLIKASYTGEGTKGLLKDGGSGRKASVEKMIKSLGGSLEIFYFAFGETDVYATSADPRDTSNPRSRLFGFTLACTLPRQFIRAH